MSIKNFFYMLLVFCGSCHSNEKENKNDSTISSAPVKSSAVNCYKYATAKDTITLKLVQIGENITGTLLYNLYEKDKSKGTIQGRMSGALLVADYTFMAEGTSSVRQIVFKKEGNYFIEGYGEIIMTGDKAAFKNLDSLQFNNSIKLAEINCQ